MSSDSSSSLLAQQLLELSEALIRFPSTSDRPEELKRVIDFVEAYFAQNNHVFIKRFERNGKYSMVISTQETRTPDILLMGHLDVVPGTESLFTPVRTEDGLLVGRGACDMKSEDAVLMMLMDELSRRENPPSLALMFTTDEEIGGHNGAKYLIEEEGYKPRLAIVPDSGQAPHELVCWNKGILQLHITMKGKAAHSSRPWLGESAIAHLVEGLHRVQAAFPPTDDPDRWYTTVNMGTIQGGTALNVVADEAKVGLDIRLPETCSHDEIVEQIQGYLGANAQIEVTFKEPPSHTSPSHPVVQLYREVLKEQQGKEAIYTKSHGGHDGRFLTAKGVPLIVSRPVSGAQHAPNEWVEIASLEPYYQLCRTFVLRAQECIRRGRC